MVAIFCITGCEKSLRDQAAEAALNYVKSASRVNSEPRITHEVEYKEPYWEFTIYDGANYYLVEVDYVYRTDNAKEREMVVYPR